MKIKYDKSADAIYISVSGAKPRKTRKIGEGLLADFDSKGSVCGIEILDASRKFAKRERAVEIGTRRIPLPAFA